MSSFPSYAMDFMYYDTLITFIILNLTIVECVVNVAGAKKFSWLHSKVW